MHQKQNLPDLATRYYGEFYDALCTRHSVPAAQKPLRQLESLALDPQNHDVPKLYSCYTRSLYLLAVHGGGKSKTAKAALAQLEALAQDPGFPGAPDAARHCADSLCELARAQGTLAAAARLERLAALLRQSCCPQSPEAALLYAEAMLQLIFRSPAAQAAHALAQLASFAQMPRHQTNRDLQDIYALCKALCSEKQTRNPPLAAMQRDMAACFWRIVAEARAEAPGGEALEALLVHKVSALGLHGIVWWQLLREQYTRLAHTQEVMAACYRMQGYFSDDSFEYFTCWLIAQGKSVYLDALRSPDTLADLPADPAGHFTFEELLYLPGDAFASRWGNPEEGHRLWARTIAHRLPPGLSEQVRAEVVYAPKRGGAWPFRDKWYPRLSAKYRKA